MKAKALEEGYGIKKGDIVKVVYETPHKESFLAATEDGRELYCKWTGCAHLSGGSWERVNDESNSTGV